MVLAGCSSPPRGDGPASDANCEVLEPALIPRCHEFVQNNLRYVVPALTDMSGVKLGTCYATIRYRFHNLADPGTGGEAQPDGTINYTTETIRGWFESDPPILTDTHELIHLLYNCARIPGRANRDHTFWDPVDFEANRAVLTRYPMPEALNQMVIDHTTMTQFLDAVTAQPDAFDNAADGCSTVETYLLDREFRRQPDRPLVREFFDRLTRDPVLANAGLYDFDRAYERAYMRVVSDLVADAPDRDALLARGCGAHRDGAR
jgi:hypothetical protein